jgi:hypothetical protein
MRQNGSRFKIASGDVLRMRVKPAVCLGLLLVALSSACCAQSAPKLNEILPRVQDHVKEFENSLPDFICDERITSRELMAGTVIHETVIDSTFRGTQSKDGGDKPFTEWREIHTIDGRPVPKGQQLTGPFFFGGGFSSMLDAIFSVRNAQYFNYKVIGTEKIDDDVAVVVKFETKKGQKALVHQELFGSQITLKGSGKAWIDPASMNVVRLELQYLDPPVPEGVLVVRVDYAEAVINEKKFWMPKTLTAQQTVPNPKVPVGGQYIAEYSNYQQFKVSTRITY